MTHSKRHHEPINSNRQHYRLTNGTAEASLSFNAFALAHTFGDYPVKSRVLKLACPLIDVSKHDVDVSKHT